MKKFILVFNILFMSCIGFSAFAKEKKIPKNLQEKYDRRVEDMKRFDTNGDGILQSKELSLSAETKFNSSDLNKDGILSEEERSAFLGQFRADTTKSYNKALAGNEANRINNRYKNADSNKDGNLSKYEYESYMSNHQANFDLNADGVISKDEYRTDGEKVPSYYRKKKD